MRTKILYIFFLSLLLTNTLAPRTEELLQTPDVAEEPYIEVNYKQADLVDFINDVASRRGMNVVLPLGANAIKEKISLNLGSIPLDTAWKRLNTILSEAEYKIVPRGDFYLVTRSSSKDNLREPLTPLYIDTPIHELPDTEELIRYLLHLKHTRLPSEKGQSEITEILTALLPQPKGEKATFHADAASNTITISAPSRNIKAILPIIQEIDKSGTETFDHIILNHASADAIARIFNEQILKSGQSDDFGYRMDGKKKSDKGYFQGNPRVIPYPRRNLLLILGNTQTVKRIKELVRDTFDRPAKSGKSVIRTYDLQYLKADEFAGVLQKVIENARSGGTEQSRGEKTSGGGPGNFFDEVKIIADTPTDPEKSRSKGGNRLIIVAREDDWKHIETLIKELDIPQPQVLLEVLIADLTIDDVRLLGSLTRNPAKIPLPSMVNFQSAHVGPGIMVNNAVVSDGTAASGTAQTIGVLEKPVKAVADLLGSNTGQSASAAAIQAGGTIISLNDDDGHTWSVLHLLKTFGSTKILSHPHLIAMDNQPAVFSLGELRRVAGEVVLSENNNNFRKQPELTANTTVKNNPAYHPNERGKSECR